MLNSYNSNSQGSKPSQNPYGIQANPVPQPTQNTGYQAPTYQPTYQPQYRPSYTPAASKPTSSQPAGFGGGENSLKIDLSQLMKKTEPAKEGSQDACNLDFEVIGADLASASTYENFPDFRDQTDYTNGAYYNPATVPYDEPTKAPASIFFPLKMSYN